MTVVEAMREDHGTLLKELRDAGPLKSGAKNEEILARLVAHFAQEERELYPMAQATGWTGGSAVTELRYQHQTLRHTFQEPLEDEKAWELLYQQVQEHFSAEELLVFPLVEHLS